MVLFDYLPICSKDGLVLVEVRGIVHQTKRPHAFPIRNLHFHGLSPNFHIDHGYIFVANLPYPDIE